MEAVTRYKCKYCNREHESVNDCMDCEIQHMEAMEVELKIRHSKRATLQHIIIPHKDNKEVKVPYQVEVEVKGEHFIYVMNSLDWEKYK